MNEQEQNKFFTRDSSSAVTQNPGVFPVDNAAVQQATSGQQQVEKLVENDLNAIRALMGMGLIDREQGQNLMKQVIKNAYTNVTTQQHDSNAQQPATTQNTAPDAFAEFAALNPDFFNQAGRSDVLAYLKNSPVNFDKDELLQISQLVEALEQNAVDRYLKKEEYGKTLNDENNIAKLRLTANAQSSNAADNNRVFTRAQIGRMSGDEFTKYEAAIMDQLRKGLIK